MAERLFVVLRRDFIFMAGYTYFFSFSSALKAQVSSGERIRCRAILKGDTVRIGDGFELTGLIECLIPGSKLYLPLTWGALGFRVLLTDSRGKKYFPAINNYHPPPPGLFSKQKNFCTMYQGMLVGETLRLPAREFFPGTGNYTIDMGYLSPVPKYFTDLSDVIVEESGLYSAEKIEVRVVL